MRHRDDYTKVAIEVFNDTKYKGYQFRKSRKLDSWLKLTWSTLFRRAMNDFDIQMLTHFCKKREGLNTKILIHGFKGLSHEERINYKCEFIGSDGYVYKRKLMGQPEVKNPIETERLGGLLQKQKEFNEARERLEEHFKKVNSIIWKGKKYRIDKWKV